jgi:hypothetical protein
MVDGLKKKSNNLFDFFVFCGCGCVKMAISDWSKCHLLACFDWPTEKKTGGKGGRYNFHKYPVFALVLMRRCYDFLFLELEIGSLRSVRSARSVLPR